MVKYSPGVQVQGKIYRTALWDPNCQPGAANCPLDSQNPIFHVQGKSERQYAGQELHKVGQTTGWTKGKVESTCANITLGSGTALFCQNFVKKGPNAPQNQRIFFEGDSGSAAFKLIGGTANIAGINWGFLGDGKETWIYSPWENITHPIVGIGRNAPIPILWDNGLIRQN